jgi:hypothetical protein
MNEGLFKNWLEIELKSKTLGDTLSDLNKICGTKYKHNWPSVMQSRDYSLDRLATNVRQYMMTIVVPELLKKYNLGVEKEIQKRIITTKV